MHRAIRAGIFNDLGSGNNVDLMVLRSDGTQEMLRNLEKPNEGSALRAMVNRPDKFTIPLGCTDVLTKEVKTVKLVSSAMDTSA